MTTEWSGEGLPPAAQARMERGRAGGPAASLFGISGQAALEACGFTPVGEVMGCIVQHIGFTGYGGCGYYGTSMGLAGGGMRLGGAGGPWGGAGAMANRRSVRSSSGGGYA